MNHICPKMVVVGGGYWPVAWWWQGGHFHVVVLAMVGVWVCSRWREREMGEEGRERNLERNLERGDYYFFLVIYFSG